MRDDYTAGGIDIDLSDPANGIEGDQVGLGAGDHDRPQRRARGGPSNRPGRAAGTRAIPCTDPRGVEVRLHLDHRARAQEAGQEGRDVRGKNVARQPSVP